ncbi:ribonuclease E/G [Parasphingopyxis sp.]|uniref:ribonuclease E/G n=1 Tax=Parasphingopyxis sp. TaxID=1920299 RepID=UPI002632FDA9|nr:ribonuclease E/G [Parasphingopyxis sp.]
MAEWLYEDGIGETRAALVDGDAILEARIGPDDAGVQPGVVCEARLIEILPGRRAGRLELENGEDALMEPLPADPTEGQALLVEIVRSAIPEPGKRKIARARMAAKGRTASPAPSLLDGLKASGLPVRTLANHEPDALEAAGWSELIEQAATGAVPFPGGALRIALTPAMTVADVDGTLPPAELAQAGARATGEAIRRLDIGGSIVIDLPSLSAKAERQAAAEALDAVLPQPFERTSVNGFGLLQVVRKRVRPSLLEYAQYECAASAARALLRRAERASGSGTITLSAHPAVIAQIKAHPDWRTALERRIGADVLLAADPALGLWGGHASAAHPA